MDLFESQELVNSAFNIIVKITKICDAVKLISDNFVHWISTKLENNLGDIEID